MWEGWGIEYSIGTKDSKTNQITKKKKKKLMKSNKEIK